MKKGSRCSIDWKKVRDSTHHRVPELLDIVHAINVRGLALVGVVIVVGTTEAKLAALLAISSSQKLVEDVEATL